MSSLPHASTKNLILILGDQLSHSLPAIAQANPANDVILMAEVNNEATYVKHHKLKIVLIFAAMRHFAQELEHKGFHVAYTTIDAPDNSGTLAGEVEKALATHQCGQLIVTEAGEYRVQEDFKHWQTAFNLPVTISEDNRFLATTHDFAQWAQGRKQLRMEYFYRDMRRRYQVLMENGQPTGGKWNYDQQNRKQFDFSHEIPTRTRFQPNLVTQKVMNTVQQMYSSHMGTAENFDLAVTREQALAVLEEFIATRLVNFGDFQDSLVQNEHHLFHSHISAYLNIGLLLPLEVILAAEQAWQRGDAPINAVEGFIRQILGWREYVRGLYWLKMPEYATENYLNAQRKLPDFYWTAKTNMNCLSQCVTTTIDSAYAHHIQRLMVLGNFALLAGVHPAQINEWFLAVYTDAFEWVEMPNVTGMATFADGGVMASKPYASSGAYIHKMSNYCQHCHYNVKEKHGATACPFNYLYWDFLHRNGARLANNPRLAMPYRTLSRMAQDKLDKHVADAQIFFKMLDDGELV